MPPFVNHNNSESVALKNISSKLFFVNLKKVCIFFLYGPGMISADIVDGTSESQFGSANSFKLTVKLLGIIL